MHFNPNISRHQTSRSLFFYLTEFNIIMFDFIFCHFLKNFKEKISKPMNEHNIPCFIRNIKILTVLVGIKSVISSLSVQIQVVHCFQINSLVNEASFFFQNKFKVDGKFIHFVVVYLFGLCFILFFYEKMQITCAIDVVLVKRKYECFVFIHYLLCIYTVFC